MEYAGDYHDHSGGLGTDFGGCTYGVSGFACWFGECSVVYSTTSFWWWALIALWQFVTKIRSTYNGDRGRFWCFWRFRALGCISRSFMYFLFIWLVMYMFLTCDVFIDYELYMLGVDTLFLFLFCFYYCFWFHMCYFGCWFILWGYSWYISFIFYFVKSRIYFVLLVFSTHAFIYLLSVSGIYRLTQSCYCLHWQLIDSS